jgi:hypothetical protein
MTSYTQVKCTRYIRGEVDFPLARAAHQHNINLALHVAERPQQSYTIRTWHYEVQKDQSDIGSKMLEKYHRVRCREAVEADGFRSAGDEIAHAAIVIDDQNSLHRRHPFSLPGLSILVSHSIK